MVFMPEDSLIDKDKVPDMSVMDALEVIRQAGVDIDFGERSLIEGIKNGVRDACNRKWIEWIVIESTVIRLGDEQGELANGDYIAIPAIRWQEHRKELGL